MNDTLDRRIDVMLRGDKVGATIFVVCLWLVVAFVLAMVWQVVPDGGIRLTLAVAASVLLAFNTAAIVAMVRHYEEDKAFIYGLDIRHLDANRAPRRRPSPLRREAEGAPPWRNTPISRRGRERADRSSIPSSSWRSST